MSSSAAVGMGPDTQLLERERELGLIGEVLDEAARGQGALVLVEGVAGIGKSALLRAARNAGADRRV